MRYDSDDTHESYTDALYEFVDLDWVETECRFCEPVRTVSREAALEIFPPTSRPLYINPLDCPYSRVKIGNKIYERKPETFQFCNCPYCHDCGIEEDNIHHIGCKMELCPKCQKQDCKCPIKRYYLPGDRKGFKIPQTLPPKIFERRLYAVNREAGLQTFLEHRLHDHKFMANNSLSRLKELAQKFSGKRMDYETFEQIWKNTLEFKDRSDRASRECGEKIRPDKVNWSRKDREALK